MPTKKREPANVEEREMQYLYEEGGDLVFMDRSNHEQITVSAQLIGDAADLMTSNLLCRVAFFNERPVDVTLPTYVQLEVTATERRGRQQCGRGGQRHQEGDRRDRRCG